MLITHVLVEFHVHNHVTAGFGQRHLHLLHQPLDRTALEHAQTLTHQQHVCQSI